MSDLINTTLFANYGAMSPVYVLTVVDIDKNGRLICTNNIDDMTTTVDVASILNERPSSGSPIGIYLNEMDAY